MVIVAQQAADLAQAFSHRIEHTAARRKFRLLRHVAELQSGLGPQHAIIERALAAQGFEQTGFAATVATDQAEALARVDLQGRMIQKGNMAKSQTSTVEGEKWHEFSSGKQRARIIV